MNERRILLVDDDSNLQATITFFLGTHGYTVQSALTGEDSLKQVISFAPDLLILDINLPDIDGFEVMHDLRRFSNVPVLILTGRSRKADVINGLESGADDYLIKPFDLDILLARVRALLRRMPARSLPIQAANGQLELDPKTRVVRVRGQEVVLTRTEYAMLLLLAQQPGEVVSHRTILQHIWGDERSDDVAYLKVYAWHLRRKLERDPHAPQVILTEWGVGYRLAP
jgi:two-component system KDP operon response regulator KdpE